MQGCDADWRPQPVRAALLRLHAAVLWPSRLTGAAAMLRVHACTHQGLLASALPRAPLPLRTPSSGSVGPALPPPKEPRLTRRCCPIMTSATTTTSSSKPCVACSPSLYKSSMGRGRTAVWGRHVDTAAACAAHCARDWPHTHRTVQCAPGRLRLCCCRHPRCSHPVPAAAVRSAGAATPRVSVAAPSGGTTWPAARPAAATRGSGPVEGSAWCLGAACGCMRAGGDDAG